MSFSGRGGGRGRGGGGGGSRGGSGHSHGRHPHHANQKRSFDNLLSQTSSSPHTYTYLPPSSSPSLSSHLPPKRPRPNPSPAASLPLTVSDVLHSTLTPLANSYWAPGQCPHLPFDPSLIQTLYSSHLSPSSALSPSPSPPPSSSPALQVLELSAYLENYLWPHFTPDSTPEHVLSILLLVNEKFRAALPAVFDGLAGSPVFPLFFQRVVALKKERDLTVYEATQYLLFLIHLFSSLEQPVVRRWALRLVSLPLWRSLSAVRREREMKGRGELREMWEKVARQCEEGKGKEDKPGVPSLDTLSSFIPRLLAEFVSILYSLPSTEPSPPDAVYDGKVLYCERFVELCIDLLSQLPTRRFFHALIDDCHLVDLCRLSPLGKGVGASSLFSRMVDVLQSYDEFDIDDHTGDPLAPDAVLSSYHQRIAHLQRVAFRDFDRLKGMALVNIASLDSRAGLEKWVKDLPSDEVRRLCVRLRLLDGSETEGDEGEEAVRRSTVTTAEIAACLPSSLLHAYLLSVLFAHHVSHPPQQQLIDTLPLYPTETLLFDDELLPPSSSHYDAVHPLPLPKLNLQFLSLADYLLRNFHLFRLEASYQIREDLAYTVSRLRPRLSNDGRDTLFTGWSRMAVPVAKFGVVAVKAARLGEMVPRQVRAEVQLDLKPFTGMVRGEWEELKEFDVLFLLTVRANLTVSQHATGQEEREEEVDGPSRNNGDHDGAFTGGGGVGGDDSTANWQRMREDGNCIVYVRGCELHQVVDESGRVIGERDEDGKQHHAVGSLRTYRVYLDPAQYSVDMRRVQEHPDEAEGEDVYTTFNLLVRRHAKENNFKGVLSSIRDILQAKRRDVELPPFLRSVFLGYGDVEASQYWKQDVERGQWQFVDTFIDEAHVRESFDRPVKLATTDEEEGSGEDGEEGEKREVISPLDVSLNASIVQTSTALVRSMTRLSKAASLPASTPPSYRLTFPLQHRPDYTALRRLTQQARYDPSQDSHRMEVSHPNLVNPAVAFAPPAQASSSAAPPVPPQLPALLPPAPFAGVEPVFSHPHPVLHVPPQPHRHPSAAKAAPAAQSASAETEASLSSLTVKVLKARLKDAGLSQLGNKADLVSRLLEHGKTDMKDDVAEEQKEEKAADTDTARLDEMKDEVGEEERKRYEAEMAAFHAAKEDFERLLSIYREEQRQHEQMEAEYRQQKAQQDEALRLYQQQLADYEERVAAAASNGAPLLEMRIEIEGPSQNLPTPPVSARTRSHDPSPPPSTAESKEPDTAAVGSTASTPTSALASPSVPVPASIVARRIPRVTPHALHVRHNTVRFTPTQVEAIHAGLNPGLTLIVGPPGTGKCFARGTRLRLYNGDLCAVEKMRGGEWLMGDDSTPRVVTPGTVIGGRPCDRAVMYRVSPSWDGAMPFTVNGAHILVLRNESQPEKRREGGGWRVVWYEVDTVSNAMMERSKLFNSQAAADKEVQLRLHCWEPLLWEVSVDDFLLTPSHIRLQCRMFQSGPVTFHHPDLLRLDGVLAEVMGVAPNEEQSRWTAWYVGLWLTTGQADDGSVPHAASSHAGIASRLATFSTLFTGAGAIDGFARRLLSAYGLLGSPHIPHALICDSLDVRCHLMAGVLDGSGFDGFLRTSYTLFSHLLDVVEGLRTLSLSLGVRASRVTDASVRQAEARPAQFAVSISGDLRLIVQHCAASYGPPADAGAFGYRKRSHPLSFPFTIEELGVDDYFGFSVHGGPDQRFLLEDFTVTHNVSDTKALTKASPLTPASVHFSSSYPCSPSVFRLTPPSS